MRTNTIIAVCIAVVLALGLGTYLVYASRTHSFNLSLPVTGATPTPSGSGVVVGGAVMSPSLDFPDNTAKANNLTIFTKGLRLTGFNPTLAEAGPFTVFAPTDTAFNALPQGSLDNLLLLANKDKLAAILSYHIVPGSYKIADLKDGQQLVTLNGQKLTVDITSDGKTLINGAIIETADVPMSNGLFDVIDTVIVPPAQ